LGPNNFVPSGNGKRVLYFSAAPTQLTPPQTPNRNHDHARFVIPSPSSPSSFDKPNKNRDLHNSATPGVAASLTVGNTRNPDGPYGQRARISGHLAVCLSAIVKTNEQLQCAFSFFPL